MSDLDPLASAIARELHLTWCQNAGHSFGDNDYEAAVKIAARVRRQIKKANT
jgi:hypothetical protein